MRFSLPVKLFLSAIFIQSLGGSVLQLMLNFYLKSLRCDETQIGLMNSVGPLVLVLTGWPIGRLSDRIGRNRGLLIGAAVGFGAALGIALSDSFPLLLGFAAARGIGEAMVSGNAAPFMAENASEENRVFLFSLEAALMTVTGFFGNLFGGHLPDFFGGDPQQALRSTLAAGAGVYGIGLLPLLAIGLRPASSRSALTVRILAPAEVRPLLFRLLLPHALIGLGAGLTMPFLNLYVKWKFQLEYESLGYLFGFSSILTAAGILVQPWMARRFGKVRAILLVQAFSIPFLLILGFVPVLALVCVAMLIRNMLMNMATPITSAFFMEKVSSDRRATVSVLAVMTWSLGWAVSSIVSGWARDRLGPDVGFQVMFAGMALLYVTSIAAFYAFWGRPRIGAPA